jgi:hypothetical protein
VNLDRKSCDRLEYAEVSVGVPGRRPKPEGERRNRHALTHEWVEVEDVPYDGPRPDLPVRWITTDEGERKRSTWPAPTVRWWDTVSTMPHCSLWTRADWQFAIDTAEVHARWVTGGRGATEVRIRERQLGTTVDARRSLRIQYVPPKRTEETAGEQPAGVVQLDDYRDLYG